jgi:hypothetical protein
MYLRLNCVCSFLNSKYIKVITIILHKKRLVVCFFARLFINMQIALISCLSLKLPLELRGRAVPQLVEELCHKAGGTGFDAV